MSGSFGPVQLLDKDVYAWMIKSRFVIRTSTNPPLTIRTQQDVFRKFSLGIYNLLIVTKSVEDLDVPKALIVIRFVFCPI